MRQQFTQLFHDVVLRNDTFSNLIFQHLEDKYSPDFYRGHSDKEMFGVGYRDPAKDGDEPSALLGTIAAVEVARFLKTIKHEKGATEVIPSQDTLELADQLYWLKRAAIQLTGRSEAVMRDYAAGSPIENAVVFKNSSPDDYDKLFAIDAGMLSIIRSVRDEHGKEALVVERGEEILKHAQEMIDEERSISKRDDPAVLRGNDRQSDPITISFPQSTEAAENSPTPDDHGPGEGDILPIRRTQLGSVVSAGDVISKNPRDGIGA